MDVCRVCKEEKEKVSFSKAQRRKHKKGARVCTLCTEKLKKEMSMPSESSWYMVRKTSGRMAVIAKRNFPKREVIAQEKPLFQVNIKVSGQRLPMAMSTLTQFSKLSERKRMLALDIPTTCEVPDEKLVLIYKEAAKKAVEQWGGIAEDYVKILRIVFYKTFVINDHLALFMGVSKMRHACQPNVLINLKKNPGVATVFALETISAGDELFVAYHVGWGPCFIRQIQLYRKFKFVCDCTRGHNPCATGSDFTRGLPCPSCCKRKRSVSRLERIGLQEGIIFPDQEKLTFKVDTVAYLCSKQADPEEPAWFCNKCHQGFKDFETTSLETVEQILELEFSCAMEVWRLGEEGLDPCEYSAEDINLRRLHALTKFGPWHFITIKWDTLVLKRLYQSKQLTTAGLPNVVLAEVIMKRLEEFAEFLKQPVVDIFPEEIRMISEIFRRFAKIRAPGLTGKAYKAQKYKALYDTRICD